MKEIALNIDFLNQICDQLTIISGQQYSKNQD